MVLCEEDTVKPHAQAQPELNNGSISELSYQEGGTHCIIKYVNHGYLEVKLSRLHISCVEIKCPSTLFICFFCLYFSINH